MNCPECRQSYAADTFECICGCKVYGGKVVAEMPKPKVTLHGAMAAWRLIQLTIAGLFVIGIGVFMITLRERLYGLVLIGAGSLVAAFGIWATSQAVRSRPPEE